jgi:hypothetical protein
MDKKELMIDFLEKFETYIKEWNELEAKYKAISGKWYVKYNPFGFVPRLYLSIKISNKMSKLTKAYQKHLEEFDEMKLESERLCAERN